MLLQVAEGQKLFDLAAGVGQIHKNSHISLVGIDISDDDRGASLYENRSGMSGMDFTMRINASLGWGAGTGRDSQTVMVGPFPEDPLKVLGIV